MSRVPRHCPATSSTAVRRRGRIARRRASSALPFGRFTRAGAAGDAPPAVRGRYPAVDSAVDPTMVTLRRRAGHLPRSSRDDLAHLLEGTCCRGTSGLRRLALGAFLTGGRAGDDGCWICAPGGGARLLVATSRRSSESAARFASSPARGLPLPAPARRGEAAGHCRTTVAGCSRPTSRRRRRRGCPPLPAALAALERADVAACRAHPPPPAARSTAIAEVTVAARAAREGVLRLGPCCRWRQSLPPWCSPLSGERVPPPTAATPSTCRRGAAGWRRLAARRDRYPSSRRCSPRATACCCRVYRADARAEPAAFHVVQAARRARARLRGKEAGALSARSPAAPLGTVALLSGPVFPTLVPPPLRWRRGDDTGRAAPAHVCSPRALRAVARRLGTSCARLAAGHADRVGCRAELPARLATLSAFSSCTRYRLPPPPAHRRVFRSRVELRPAASLARARWPSRGCFPPHAAPLPRCPCIARPRCCSASPRRRRDPRRWRTRWRAAAARERTRRRRRAARGALREGIDARFRFTRAVAAPRARRRRAHRAGEIERQLHRGVAAAGSGAGLRRPSARRAAAPGHRAATL